MKIVIKEPNKRAEVVEFEEDGKVLELEELQDLVGGYIEYTGDDGLDGIDMILDEEGKLKGREFNFRTKYDFLVGTVVFAFSNDEGETIGLTDEQVETVKRYLRGSVEC